MSRFGVLWWALKRWLWARWQVLRFTLSKPQKIGVPQPTGSRIAVAPLGEVYSKIPLRNVVGAERLPREESRLAARLLVAVGLFLNRVLPPMRRGLPEIDANIRTALDDALMPSYAKAFRAPIRPSTFKGDGPLDLGELAVMSPYAVLTERDSDGLIQWDLCGLGDFAHQDGLCSLGLRVIFTPTPDESGPSRLVASRIDTREFGVVHPGDAAWATATSLAVCAATTHLALTRHFNYVHLITGDHWDVATRNGLPTEHPLYRLLWPHVFNSFYTNYGVTRVQMLPDGDFVNMFSFTHDGLMAYFDAMYTNYDIAMIDPAADRARRGLSGEEFDCPTQTNLVELFDLMHAHASRYIDTYYGSDAELATDTAVRGWLEELDSLVPNGLDGAIGGDVTKVALSRLIGGYICEGNTMHDLVGTTLWDYQLWADRNPVRISRDGSRMPVDVFQRTVNNNFALQLRRAPMLADYGHVALDPRGAALFTQFYEDCQSLQARYDQSPAGPWRMEPKNLEINMNG